MTAIRKNYRGNWEACSTFPMPELGVDKLLDITTTKTYSGELTTRVIVNTKEGQFVTHMMYQDFAQHYIVSNYKCTEKKVREQHALALSELDLIKALAVSHYAKQAAA